MKTKETLFLLLCFILSTEAFSQKGPEWLKDAVIYHIYPSSFQDSDGNGIGDLKGIHSRLDYIRSIGVTPFGSALFSLPNSRTADTTSLTFTVLIPGLVKTKH